MFVDEHRYEKESTQVMWAFIIALTGVASLFLYLGGLL
jgi:hypothetical protein|tara:strand:+ start:1553 stop:1666 length:114 start_codon:yes stop_codon:yes gene_type:complete